MIMCALAACLGRTIQNIVLNGRFQLRILRGDNLINYIRAKNNISQLLDIFII
jgi:hypothetical protein